MEVPKIDFLWMDIFDVDVRESVICTYRTRSSRWRFLSTHYTPVFIVLIHCNTTTATHKYREVKSRKSRRK